MGGAACQPEGARAKIGKRFGHGERGLGHGQNRAMCGAGAPGAVWVGADVPAADCGAAAGVRPGPTACTWRRLRPPCRRPCSSSWRASQSMWLAPSGQAWRGSHGGRRSMLLKNLPRRQACQARYSAAKPNTCGASAAPLSAAHQPNVVVVVAVVVIGVAIVEIHVPRVVRIASQGRARPDNRRR